MQFNSSLNTTQTVKSYAKLNLALRITGRRADGFHNLSTIFQEIDFHDTLHFQPANSFSLTTSDPHLQTDERNLCTRAYKLLWERFQPRQAFQIHLEKRIPMGAGLGGGSSNAAAVLKFLDRAWDLNLGLTELEQIGRTLGSDVPFFIKGGTQGAMGVGDMLIPLNLPENVIFLLVIPPIQISTTWAYQQFKPIDFKPNFDFSELINGNRICWELYENQFEAVVFPAFPAIRQVKMALLQTRTRYAGLSGSGSTVFAVYEDLAAARSAAQAFPAYHTIITKPIQR